MAREICVSNVFDFFFVLSHPLTLTSMKLVWFLAAAILGLSTQPLEAGHGVPDSRTRTRTIGTCVDRLCLRGGSSTVGLEPVVTAKIEALLKSAPVMLFMKGTPEHPQCGFSNSIIRLLQQAGIHFSSFNIFDDESVRQGLKIYSNWPTYPQLYSNGQLVGGLDVVKELFVSGDLQKELKRLGENGRLSGSSSSGAPADGPKIHIAASILEEKIKSALQAEHVMVRHSFLVNWWPLLSHTG